MRNPTPADIFVGAYIPVSSINVTFNNTDILTAIQPDTQEKSTTLVAPGYTGTFAVSLSSYFDLTRPGNYSVQVFPLGIGCFPSKTIYLLPVVSIILPNNPSIVDLDLLNITRYSNITIQGCVFASDLLVFSI